MTTSTSASTRRHVSRGEWLLSQAAKVIKKLPLGCRRFALVLVRPVPGRLGLALRQVLASSLSRTFGHKVLIYESVYLFRPERMSVGSRVSIHPMCYIDATAGLEIGSDVSIAHGTTIMTTEHDYSPDARPIRENRLKHFPVKIGNDVWIGAGVKILAGVEIGDRVVVGAGAVVTKDIPFNSVAVGIPARVLKSIGSSQ